MGSYWRMEHEDLLLGVRPRSPTHFIDATMSSVIRAKRTRSHSEKLANAHRLSIARLMVHFQNSSVASMLRAGMFLETKPAPLISADDGDHLLAAY